MPKARLAEREEIAERSTDANEQPDNPVDPLKAAVTCAGISLALWLRFL